MKLKHLILFAFLFICSCDILFDESESKPKPDTKGLLIGAKSLSYFDLPENVKKEAHDGYAFHRSYTKSDFLKKEDGYYVRMIVNYGYAGYVIKGFEKNYGHNLFYIGRNKDIDTAQHGLNVQ